MFPQLYDIFTEVIALEDPVEQEELIVESCQGDEQLLSLVRGMVKASSDPEESFLRPFATFQEPHNHSDDEKTLPCDFGDYLLEEKIGQGGMGVVYRGTQVKLRRPVAVKMIRNSNLATRQEVERFNAEARSAAALSHPGIVPVIESGKIEGQHFFSMGFVDGINLAKLMEKQTVSIEQVISLAKEIAEAMHYAHEKGVIHRDLKPENILIDFRENEKTSKNHYQALISDFGLAKRREHDLGLTMDGEVLGTPGYMSPEQAHGSSEITEATDIYSIGALLYFMLIKHAPFQEKNAWETLEKVRKTPPTRPRSIRPFIPKDLETICLKALEKNPENRYSSCAELEGDLRNFTTGHPLLAKRTGIVSRAFKACRRNPILTSLAVIGSLLTASLIFFPLKLKYSQEKIEKEKISTNVARQEAGRQSAKNELIKAVQAVGSQNHHQALKLFLKTARLAKEVDDKETLMSARWGMNDSSNRLWKLDGTLDALHQVDQIILSEDGRTLAITAHDPMSAPVGKKFRLQLFDLQTRQSLFLDGFPSKIQCLAFHPLENWLLVADGSSKLHRFTRKNDRFFADGIIQIENPNSSTNGVQKFGFSSDGNKLFTLDTNGKLSLWNINSDPTLAADLSQKESLHLVASSRSDLLLGISSQGHLYGWNLLSGNTLFGPIPTEYHASQMVIDKTGQHVALIPKSAGPGRIYQLKNHELISSKNPVYTNFAHQKTLAKVQFGGPPGTLVQLEKSGVLQSGINGQPLPNNDAQNFVINSGGTTLISTHTRDRVLKIWRSGPFWNHQITLDEAPGKLITMGSPASLASLTETGIDLYPPIDEIFSQKRSARPVSTIPLKGKPVAVLNSHSQDSSFCLTQNHQGLLFHHLGADSSTVQWTKTISLKGPAKMQQISNGDLIVCYSTRRLQGNPGPNIAVINLEKKIVRYFLVTLPDIACATASSTHPSAIMLASRSGIIAWFDSQKGEIIRRMPPSGDTLTTIASSPSKKLIALGFQTGRIMIYDEKTWEEVGSFQQNESISTLSFSRQGELLISSEGSNAITIREIVSGLIIGNKMTHTDSITSIDLCVQSNRIVTFSEKGEVKAWPLPKPDLRPLDEIEETAKRQRMIVQRSQRRALRPPPFAMKKGAKLPDEAAILKKIIRSREFKKPAKAPSKAD